MAERLSTITRCAAPECGQLIQWCMTELGKRMPLQLTPSADGRVVITMLPDGTIRGRVLGGHELPAQVEAYRPHHQVCPGAADYRRRLDIAAPKCRARCGYQMDRWLIEHGYPAHINCLPPIGLRDAVRALRGQPNDPTPPADQLPGLDDQERA